MITVNSDYTFENNTIVTIGKFDGLHEGHTEIFKYANSIKSDEMPFVSVSFITHPDIVINDNYKGALLSYNDKVLRLEQLGVDFYIELPFNREMMNTEAEEFFNKYIINKWSAKVLVVGDDFNIGKNRKGDITFLKKLCKENNIELIVISRKIFGDKPISSSYIKNELSNGNIKNANSMLGYNYYFEGKIIHGNHIGRTIGFPTINISIENNKFLPKFGVYGSKVIINNSEYKSISNIGVKPTVENNSEPLIETYIYDFNSDIYDLNARVELLDFIRPEQKFNSFEELKNQINIDKNSWTNN